MSDWLGWTELLGEAAVLAVAFIAIYDAARRFALHGFTRGASLMLAVGLLFPVYEGGVSLTVPGRVRQQIIEQASLRVQEPAGGWEKLPGTPDERSKQSIKAATINFMVSGQVGQVLDAAGNRVAYAPTQQELQAREALVRDQKGAEDSAEHFFERGERLFMTALASLLVGVVVGFVQRRRAPR